MARTVADTNLQTRAARARLAPQRKPYWATLRPRLLHLGYAKRRPGKPGYWTVRTYIGSQSYETKRIDAVADDYEDANGETVRVIGMGRDQTFANVRKIVVPDAGAGADQILVREGVLVPVKSGSPNPLGGRAEQRRTRGRRSGMARMGDHLRLLGVKEAKAPQPRLGGSGDAATSQPRRRSGAAHPLEWGRLRGCSAAEEPAEEAAGALARGVARAPLVGGDAGPDGGHVLAAAGPGGLGTGLAGDGSAHKFLLG